MLIFGLFIVAVCMSGVLFDHTKRTNWLSKIAKARDILLLAGWILIAIGSLIQLVRQYA